MISSHRPLLACCAPLALGFLALLNLSGCAAVGLLGQTMQNEIPAAYKGFAGQTVAIMVYADRGVLTDWPRLQLDISGGIEAKLKTAITAKTEELKGTTFPVSPASVFRFQEDNPDIDEKPIAETAPKIGVTRLIYIEIQNFQTRSDQAIELYRGSITALVKVMAIKDGKATLVYEEGNIRSVYPPKSNEEGLPALGDEKVYAGTIDEFTTDISTRFVPHPGAD